MKHLALVTSIGLALAALAAPSGAASSAADCTTLEGEERERCRVEALKGIVGAGGGDSGAPIGGEGVGVMTGAGGGPQFSFAASARLIPLDGPFHEDLAIRCNGPGLGSGASVTYTPDVDTAGLDGYTRHVSRAGPLAPDLGPGLSVAFWQNRATGHQRISVTRVRADLFTPGAAGMDYDCEILSGSDVIAREEIRGHHEFQRWSWQNKLPPERQSPSQLIEARLVFPLEHPPIWHPSINNPSVGENGYAPLADPASPYHIGLRKGMGNAGDRQDIGPLTEGQARYVVLGDPKLYQLVLMQAEVAGAVPWNVIDPETGAPIRYDGKHKDVILFEPRLKNSQTRVLPAAGGKGGWGIDQPHQPALSYLPYLLTRDPYYLQNLQLQCAHNMGDVRGNRVDEADQTLRAMRTGSERGWVWSLRTLFHCFAATRHAEDVAGPLPGWLLSSAYFKRYLDYELEETMAHFERGGLLSRFGLRRERKDKVPRMRSFMIDYGPHVLAHMVWYGLDEWRPVLDRRMENLAQRHNQLKFAAVNYNVLFGNDAGEVAASWDDLAKYNPVEDELGSFRYYETEFLGGLRAGRLAGAEPADLITRAIEDWEAEIGRLCVGISGEGRSPCKGSQFKFWPAERVE